MMSANYLRLISASCIFFLFSGCNGTHRVSTANSSAAVEATKDYIELRRAIDKIAPFFKSMGKPGKDDWLWTYKEPGQTFEEYIASSPVVPTPDRKIIYIQPLGEFRTDESKVIGIVSDYVKAFYGLDVRKLPVKSLPSKLFEPDQRMIDYPKQRQIRTGSIMDELLRPALPKDAAALIAFTSEDLYPDSSMYFVFGQASLENRVGVWSLFRLDDRADFARFLERTMKISVHEIGHMFSFRHCTKYECVMSGTNHLGETDRRPIDACPECMAKIAWMTKQKPIERYERLIGFARANKLKKAILDFERKKKAVE